MRDSRFLRFDNSWLGGKINSRFLKESIEYAAQTLQKLFGYRLNYSRLHSTTETNKTMLDIRKFFCLLFFQEKYGLAKASGYQALLGF